MRRLICVGLGLVVGAVLHRPAFGQDTTRARARRDSLPRDTLKIPVPLRGDTILLRDSTVRPDTAPGPAVKRDTIKAPLAHAEQPVGLALGSRTHWNRAELFATGAATAADFLETIPGVTTFKTGWLSSPAAGAYLGDFRRIRVYFDGIAWDALDPRSPGVLDLSQIPLWALEEVTVEQTADEVRIFLRTWRTQSTVPSTRTDVSTGDQSTNLYRAFYGKRFDPGASIQFGAQEYGTQPPNGSSSDQLGLMSRVGWAGAGWSVDAFALRTSQHRGELLAVTSDSIPYLAATRTDAYVRLSHGDPDTSRFWMQVIAAASKYDFTSNRHGDTTSTDSALTAADSSRFRGQYVAALGATLGGLRLSFTERVREGAGLHLGTPTLRASYASDRFSVTGLGETLGADSSSREEVTAVLRPLSFVSVLGSVTHRTDHGPVDSTASVTDAKVEVGVRIRGLWFSGGMLRRDSTRLLAPTLLNIESIPTRDSAATAALAEVRGQIWKALYADVWGIRWSDTAGLYRPRYQARSELYISTNLISRIPSGNFGLLASVYHEYRSTANFPTSSGLVAVPGYRTLNGRLEIRILSATLSYQFRNMLVERYQMVPGFFMPHQLQFYGVRWEFWN